MIENRPLGAKLTYCCAIALFTSGYALQAFSFSMPGLVQDWQLPDALIGPLLASALIGLLPGYMFIAPLADRIGERPVICAALLGLAGSTLLCLLADGFLLMALGRFATGAAIGAAIPGAVAIASQQGAPRWRGAQVVGIYIAFSLGFLAAGLASGWLVPRWHWRAPWGLILPLALCTAMLFRIMLPSHAPKQAVSRPLAALFAPRWRKGTLLFWLISSIGLGLFYALQAWLPLLSTRGGSSFAGAVTATSLFTLGTALGAAPMIWWADRMGPFRALVAMSGLGLAGIVLLGGLAGPGGALFHAAALLAGIGIGGGQKGAIAAASLFYPPALRSTGLGWALGIGRLGAACGPLLIGYLTMHDVESGRALLSLAAPVPLMMLAAFWLHRAYGRIDLPCPYDTPSPCKDQEK